MHFYIDLHFFHVRLMFLQNYDILKNLLLHKSKCTDVLYNLKRHQVFLAMVYILVLEVSLRINKYYMANQFQDVF